MCNPHLDYLHEVARQGSMSTASEKLGVAVSSISRQLAKLEKDPGITAGARQS
jgi:DNA-binding transcriptional LysR family regulator